MMPLLEAAGFGFSLWLGLYLLARNPDNLPLRFTGLGSLAYALALALESLLGYWPAVRPAWLEAARWLLIALPALCWLAALIGLRRGETTARPPVTLGVVAVATLFFGLGLGLIVFPLGWFPRAWVLLAIGLDFAALGAAIAALDAFDEGQALRPDMARSLAGAAFAALLFSGPIALVVLTSTGLTGPMWLLLLAIVGLAVATQVLADPIQAGLDRLAFAGAPEMSRQRAHWRAAAEALPRGDRSLDVEALGDLEFARLTRRALSHMGDLARLSASPLTRLPAVTARLAVRGARDDSLERAQELKALLAESIGRLKPRGKGDFGTADEWRHYNALYFPYVAGLKPYARRAGFDDLDEAGRQALEWFRAAVPSRTLHNWQTAAARLVAQDLRGRPG